MWHVTLLWPLLRILSVGKLVAWADRSHRSKAIGRMPAGMTKPEFAHRCEQLACVAARNGLYQATCLPTALALHHLLGSYGVHSTLKIGVKPGSQPLQAHAWVAYEQQTSDSGINEYHVVALPLTATSFTNGQRT